MALRPSPSASIRTGIDGGYIVALDPYSTYDVSIAAAGFEPLRFPVTNNDGSDPNVLGNVTLLPAQGGGGVPPAPTYGQVTGYAVQLASLSDTQVAELRAMVITR